MVKVNGEAGVGVSYDRHFAVGLRLKVVYAVICHIGVSGKRQAFRCEGRVSVECEGAVKFFKVVFHIIGSVNCRPKDINSCRGVCGVARCQVEGIISAVIFVNTSASAGADKVLSERVIAFNRSYCLRFVYVAVGQTESGKLVARFCA